MNILITSGGTKIKIDAVKEWLERQKQNLN